MQARAISRTRRSTPRLGEAASPARPRCAWTVAGPLADALRGCGGPDGNRIERIRLAPSAERPAGKTIVPPVSSRLRRIERQPIHPTCDCSVVTGLDELIVEACRVVPLRLPPPTAGDWRPEDPQVQDGGPAGRRPLGIQLHNPCNVTWIEVRMLIRHGSPPRRRLMQDPGGGAPVASMDGRRDARRMTRARTADPPRSSVEATRIAHLLVPASRKLHRLANSIHRSVGRSRVAVLAALRSCRASCPARPLVSHAPVGFQGSPLHAGAARWSGIAAPRRPALGHRDRCCRSSVFDTHAASACARAWEGC